MRVGTFNRNFLRKLFGLAASGCLLGLAFGIPAVCQNTETASTASSAGAAPKPVAEATTGPTLRLDYGNRDGKGSPVADFMYFVALVSPEPVSIVTSPGNTQRMRVLSNKRQIGDKSFRVVCEVEFTGEGYERNAIDQSKTINRQQEKLKAGGSLNELLVSINVEGKGRASFEVDGAVTNHVPIVNEVKLQFHGQESPVTVSLHDIKYVTNSFVAQNEIVARVSSLLFKRQSGPPKMEISLASVKPRDAGNTLWQNFVGGVKGMAANLLLKPVAVEREGHEAMLNFGSALVSQATAFTFPSAKNLKPGP